MLQANELVNFLLSSIGCYQCHFQLGEIGGLLVEVVARWGCGFASVKTDYTLASPGMQCHMLCNWRLMSRLFFVL